MKLTRYRAIACLLLMCVSIAINAQGNSQDTTFQKGARAYKSGDYAAALEYFNQARAAGNSKATVIYNQGVTLYKLNRLEQAEAVFRELLGNKKWVDLARYNLGRIAEDQNNHTAARNWYLQVRQNTGNEKLRGLADMKLSALAAASEKSKDKTGIKQKKSASKKSAILLNLEATADDNATSMADELSRRSSDTADTYISALAYGHYYFSGRPGDGVKLYGLAYARRFQTYSNFDATVLGIGGAREITFDDLKTELGVRVTEASVGSGHLANQYAVSAKLKKPLPAGRVKLDYQTSYFDAADTYSQLNGWQHQLQLAWRHSYKKLTFEPAVKWQNNQREDKEVNGNYYSYSPTSLSLLAKLKWKMSDDLTLHTVLEQTRASYSGENRMTDIGGIAKQQQRKSSRQNWTLGAKYRLSPRWAVNGEYVYTNVDDDFDIYSYDKSVFAVKLEYVY